MNAREKLRRNHALLEDQGRRSQVFHQAFVGQACEVLVEGPSLRNEARWAGRTRQNILAIFDVLPGLKAGDLVMMRVAQATAQALYGKIERKAEGGIKQTSNKEQRTKNKEQRTKNSQRDLHSAFFI